MAQNVISNDDDNDDNDNTTNKQINKKIAAWKLKSPLSELFLVVGEKTNRPKINFHDR